jgi:hypothetical protein
LKNIIFEIFSILKIMEFLLKSPRYYSSSSAHVCLGFNFSKRLFHYPDPNLVKTKFRTFDPNAPNPSLELVPKTSSIP